MKAADPLGNDISGDNQVGTVTRTLKDPLVIRVVDDKGYPVMGAPVGFKILEQPKENMQQSPEAMENPAAATEAPASGDSADSAK